jgi:hypothetical protein
MMNVTYCGVFISDESFITNHLIVSHSHSFTVFILNSPIRLLILCDIEFCCDSVATPVSGSFQLVCTIHITDIFTQRALAPDKCVAFLSYTTYVNVNVGRPGDMCCPGPVWVIPGYGFKRHDMCSVGCKSLGDRQQFGCSHDPTTSSDTVWSRQGCDLCRYHDRTGHGCFRLSGESSYVR